MVALFTCLKAPALQAEQDQPKGEAVVDLIERIEALKLPVEDEYELFYLQVDCAIEAATAASMSGDADAVEKASALLKKLAAQAGVLEDPWSRDALLAYLAMLSAQSGQPQAAEAIARSIATRCYQSEALGVIASQRARAGDMEGFKRLSAESLGLLDQALKEDAKKLPEDRDWPSWLTWTLTYQWAGDVFYSDRLPHEEGVALAKELAASFAEMPLEPGAKAEALGFLASVVAGYGDEQGAKALLAQTHIALAQERKRVEEAQDEEDGWSYGTESAYIEVVRAYLVLGDLPAAERELSKVESAGMRTGAEAIMGAHLKVLYNDPKAEAYLTKAATFLRETDRVLDSLMKGVEPPNFDFDQYMEDFGDYDTTSFLWDAYYVALDLQRAGDTERVDQLIEGLKVPMIKIGAELGRMRSQREFEVVVIGGGHAGAEAAWAAANSLQADGGGRVALITMDPSKTGAMSCNPCIGGLAKGQIVREIDALGGLMGLAADATGIQFRVLNASRGPAVHGPRCQSDKYAYAREVQRLLHTRPNLVEIAGLVDDFIIEDGRCVGVKYRPAPTDGPEEPTDGCCGEFGCIDDVEKPITLHAKAVVLTTGTFMRAIMHTGQAQAKGGRVGEGTADGISGTLKRLGFELGRLKTGTPPRLARESLDLDSLEVQPGDEQPVPFSDMTGTKPMLGEHGLPKHDAYIKVQGDFPRMTQTPCWITHTNAQSHELIRDNLDKAPMYNGQITTAGPRYCPSIEDKVVRFADRQSHHVFLEPESHETNEVYCNGISTSLPAEVQDVIIRSLPGCENAKVLKYGYAVEYDTIVAHQLDATCMTKVVPGLFTAGQINGTSGYEEAAGQGLVAGLNAVRYARGQELVRLGRDLSYIGVMMDDLVTKVPVEPYRMFTSRAEHRLLLRSDNAATRLTPLGRELGLVDDERWAVYNARRVAQQIARSKMHGVKVNGQRMIVRARQQGEIQPKQIVELLENEWLFFVGKELLSRKHFVSAATELLADLHYAGYIKRQQREVERLQEQEAQALPTNMDYAAVSGLRNEAQLVLNQFKPATLGQAGRLEGVNPADLMVVSVYLNKHVLTGDA
eukprot:g14819.t1